MTETNQPANAVVTGAGRGLGAAIADALCDAGINVLGCGPQAGEDAILINARKDGRGALYQIGCDITRSDTVQRTWDAAVEIFGTVDLWINNAGLALTGAPLAMLESEKFGKMVDINLVGTMNACRIAIAGMEKQGSGAIWNMLGAGWDGTPVAGMNGYATTKAALTFLTRALASEAQDQPYTIGGISPGLVMTEGFFREHRQVPAEHLAAREAVINVIGDHPETIARWIAQSVSVPARNDQILVWLTPEKIAARQAESPPRDILSRYRSDI
jgi:NAD(P)-dependent dehydrogenase (short-subunit alcohol dehydrogenase family)